MLLSFNEVNLIVKPIFLIKCFVCHNLLLKKKFIFLWYMSDSDFVCTCEIIYKCDPTRVGLRGNYPVLASRNSCYFSFCLALNTFYSHIFIDRILWIANCLYIYIYKEIRPYIIDGIIAYLSIEYMNFKFSYFILQKC
jgi:hypothetical protein